MRVVVMAFIFLISCIGACGNLVINTQERHATLNGEKIKVTNLPKECVSKSPSLYEGRKNGPQWDCYDDGGWKQAFYWASDKKEGRQIKWYPDGRKALHGSFLNGRRSGHWKWHPSRWLFGGAEGEFREGKPHGTWTWWKRKNHTRTFRKSWKTLGQASFVELPIESLEGAAQVEGSYFKNEPWRINELPSWPKLLFSSVKAQGDYKAGKQEGIWIEWYENGQKLSECRYKGGFPDKVCTVWYDTGAKESERHFLNGKSDGIEIHWYQDGKKASEGRNKEGRRDGKWSWWKEEGGTWTFGDENRRLRESLVKEGIVPAGGKHEPWFGIGMSVRAEGTYVDSKLEGTWREWYESGAKSLEGAYRGGNRHGLWTTWNKEGQKVSVRTFKDDKLEGINTSWGKNGKKYFEASYKNGLLEGAATQWRPNGKKAWQGNYRNGVLEGFVGSWYPNGKRSWEGYHKNGKREGKWVWWNEKGVKLKSRYYKNGKLKQTD